MDVLGPLSAPQVYQASQQLKSPVSRVPKGTVGGPEKDKNKSCSLFQLGHHQVLLSDPLRPCGEIGFCLFALRLPRHSLQTTAGVFACPVECLLLKCLPREMRSLFHLDETYFYGAYPIQLE